MFLKCPICKTYLEERPKKHIIICDCGVLYLFRGKYYFVLDDVNFFSYDPGENFLVKSGNSRTLVVRDHEKKISDYINNYLMEEVFNT
jgi:hypothetical protein